MTAAILEILETVRGMGTSIPFQYALSETGAISLPCTNIIYCKRVMHVSVLSLGGGGGAGIGRAFDTIFRSLCWAFDDTGLPDGRPV